MMPFPTKAQYGHEQIRGEMVQKGNHLLCPTICKTQVGGILRKELHGVKAVLKGWHEIEGCPHHRIE